MPEYTPTRLGIVALCFLIKGAIVAGAAIVGALAHASGFNLLALIAFAVLIWGASLEVCGPKGMVTWFLHPVTKLANRQPPR